jgi:hypothetical protein
MRYGTLILILFLTPALADAHALGVQAKLKDGKVHVEVYYDDDTPAIKAKVKVLSGKDEIAAGVTDKDGLWSFAKPDAGKYEIHADAGAGHAAKTTLTIPRTTATPVSLSDGPSREEFTSTPWLKIGIGVGAIAVMCTAFLLASMIRKTANVDNAKAH